MLLTIPIAHDFVCPWCWIGWQQARRLETEFGITIDWRGYELMPDELPWEEPVPPVSVNPNRPAVPSRFQLLLAAEGSRLPAVSRPHRMRTGFVHQAVEYAKTEGPAIANALIDALYRAYWERGEAINVPDVLVRIAHGIVQNPALMLEAARTRKFQDQVIGFDDPAYATGVFNVPTFFIGGERYAEQPYSVLAEAVQRERKKLGEVDIYARLTFPEPPARRPYVFVNMVTTIDGKILTGERDEPVSDLGSKVDHLLMHRTERAADAILLGAQTLRATPASWNPAAATRVVVTRGQNLDFQHQYFTGGTGIIATSGSNRFEGPEGIEVIRTGEETLDFADLLRQLRDRGVKNLLVLGGSDLNGQLIRQDLVDELFLTVAPKVRLGDDVPTYAGGPALPRAEIKQFRIVESHVVGDEIFVRYRRREAEAAS